MATIKNDTFTEASDTALKSHTSDSGGSWQGSSTIHQVEAATNSAEIISTPVSTLLGDETPSSADYSVEIEGVIGGTSTNDRCGVVMRGQDGASHSASSSDYYFLRVTGNTVGSMTWNCWSVNGGTPQTQLGSGTLSNLDTDDTFKLKAEIEGFDPVTIRVYYDENIDGGGYSGYSLLATLTDTNATNPLSTPHQIQGAGNPGIYQRNTNSRINSFFAADLVTATPKSSTDSGSISSSAEDPIDTRAFTTFDIGNIQAVEAPFADAATVKTDSGSLSATESNSILKDPEFVSGTADSSNLSVTETTLIETGTGTAKSSLDGDANTFDSTDTSALNTYGPADTKSSTDELVIDDLRVQNYVYRSSSYTDPAWTNNNLFVNANVLPGPNGVSADRITVFDSQAAASIQQSVTMEDTSRKHYAFAIVYRQIQSTITSVWFDVDNIAAKDLTTWFNVGFNLGQNVWSVGTTGADVINAGAEFYVDPLGQENDYWVIWIEFETDASDVIGDLHFGLCDADGSKTLTKTTSQQHVHVAGMQVDKGSFQQVYIDNGGTLGFVDQDQVALDQIDAFISTSDALNIGVEESSIRVISGTVLKTGSDSANLTSVEVGFRNQEKSSTDNSGTDITSVETASITQINYDPGWEEDDVPWGGLLLQSKDLAPIFPVGQDFFILGSGPATLEILLERKAVVYEGGRAILGRTVFPQIIGPYGSKVLISLGGHNEPDGAVDWEGPYEFTIGEDISVDFAVAGRYIAIKFESVDVTTWRLPSFDIDYEVVGVY